MNSNHSGTVVSVVIPTHLPRSLDRTLQALSRQTNPSFEVIVVENGVRSEQAAALCDRWRGRLNLRYRFDPRAGLNRARNTGARMASGRYVALLDDDCRPSETWVESILANHAAFPEAGAIGGPLRLDFESPPPDWLVGEFRTCLSELDRGPETRSLEPGEYFFGANMAFPGTVFEATGGFPEDIGMNTREPPQLANDEIAFLEAASRESGSGLVYCPDMSVTHFIPASRLSLDRMFQRRYGQGLSDVALMRWRHGPASGKTVERYLNSVFPHPWHFHQLDNRLQQLEPETAAQYLRNHVICRAAYLCGYRQALSESIGPQTRSATSESAPGGRMDDGSVRLARRIARKSMGRDPQTIVTSMAGLMYRGKSVRTGQSVKRADNRLRLLGAMAGFLEPGLFESLPSKQGRGHVS